MTSPPLPWGVVCHASSIQLVTTARAASPGHECQRSTTCSPHSHWSLCHQSHTCHSGGLRTQWPAQDSWSIPESAISTQLSVAIVFVFLNKLTTTDQQQTPLSAYAKTSCNATHIRIQECTAACTFLPQYIRMKPCILPITTISI